MLRNVWDILETEVLRDGWELGRREYRIVNFFGKKATYDDRILDYYK